MQQVRLKTVIRNLSLVSVYLLFLSVQLNLKYTFSDPISSIYPGTVLSNKNAGNNTRSIEKSSDDKPAIQKSRLNKRYVHEDVFLIYSLIDELVINLYKRVDKIFIPIPRVFNTSYCKALLRGPPSLFPAFC